MLRVTVGIDSEKGFMKRGVLVVVVASAMVLMAVLALQAQASVVSLLQPVVVNVNQAVPVNVTVGGVVGGQVVTLTAPMTMNVAVQVQLVGRAAAVVAAQAAPAQPAPSAPATAAGTIYHDSRGIPYKLDVRAPYQLTQIESSVDGLGEVNIIGEIRNTGPDTLQYVKAIITFYKDGKIIDLGEGYTKLDRLTPGQSSPFMVPTSMKPDQVHAFTVQIDGQKAR